MSIFDAAIKTLEEDLREFSCGARLDEREPRNASILAAIQVLVAIGGLTPSPGSVSSAQHKPGSVAENADGETQGSISREDERQRSLPLDERLLNASVTLRLTGYPYSSEAVALACRAKKKERFDGTLDEGPDMNEEGAK